MSEIIYNHECMDEIREKQKVCFVAEKGIHEHEYCEDIEHNGRTHVVCHVCKTTLKVLGRKCEVYSRVVGYLRPVKQWNVGKKEEFKNRTTYKLEQ